MPRIISLLPSATEIVCSLGFQADLVGRSHECDFPVGLERLPVLTSPSFPVSGTSLAIDREVKSLLERGLSLYRVDTEALKALRPDFIVTQSQCEVCAVSESELSKALSDWVGNPAQIISLQPNFLSDVWQDLLRVARTLSVPEKGEALVSRLMAKLKALTESLPDTFRRPKVACIEWFDPLMAAGNWVPELVGMAGGENCFGKAGEHSPWLRWEDLSSADPEFLVLMPCGFSIERSRSAYAELEANPMWASLTAVKRGRVFVVDGNQYFNRPGPRLVESTEILAEILHPERFDFGHRGIAWQIY